MVEGPGARRNAQKASRAIGFLVSKVVSSSSSSVNDRNSSNHDGLSRMLVAKTLVDAFSVGKECFLLFDSGHQAGSRENDQYDATSANTSVALRFHFGMNGSLCVLNCSEDESKTSSQGYKRNHGSTNPLAPSLHIEFQRVKSNIDRLGYNLDNNFLHLKCFQTAVSSCGGGVALSKKEALQHLDCCAPDNLFSLDGVISSLQSRPGAMICDAVLDQSKFPGVGNIIKIEGLHRASVNPKTFVSDLSREKLSSIVLECRKYALSWLRSGRSPVKRVYNQTTCGSCRNGTVRMVKLGRDLSRVTFWCELCQPFTLIHCDSGGNSLRTKRYYDHLESTSSVKENQDGCNAFKIPRLRDPNKQGLPHGGLSTTGRKSICCPQHGSRTIRVKRVRHSPNLSNRNRLFAACNVNGCQYFAWVDLNFPPCQTCKSRTILRVSKTEKSGGRWFFSCDAVGCGGGRGSIHCHDGRRDQTDCTKKGHFSWAEPNHLSHIQSFLSPLL